MLLRVSRTWVLAQIIGLFGFSSMAYATVLGHLGMQLSPLAVLWVGVVLLAALNLTVLIHEGGHALAAMALGIRVRAIVLAAYGGATVRDVAPTPSADRYTAAAGPLANLVAAGLGLACLRVLDPESAAAGVLSVAIALQAVNALVNLLPVWRCDGARIFR